MFIRSSCEYLFECIYLEFIGINSLEIELLLSLIWDTTYFVNMCKFSSGPTIRQAKTTAETLLWMRTRTQIKTSFYPTSQFSVASWKALKFIPWTLRDVERSLWADEQEQKTRFQRIHLNCSGLSAFNRVLGRLDINSFVGVSANHNKSYIINMVKGLHQANWIWLLPLNIYRVILSDTWKDNNSSQGGKCLQGV